MTTETTLSNNPVNQPRRERLMKGRYSALTAILLLILMKGGLAGAGTKVENCTASGSSVDVPVDMDSDSCFPVGQATVCIDTSGYNNFAGKCSPGGGFTGQGIIELDLTPGTSCNIGGNTVPGIASCTLADSGEQGCALELAGGSEVRRDNDSGDLLFLTFSTVPFCIDLSSGPPFNYTDTFTGIITGGTGKNAGATGTEAGSSHGQILTSDAASHGLSWATIPFTDTITTKEHD